MSYYLNKFKGTYRLISDIDAHTNDFPRDETGKIEDNDVYIKCRKGKIYHYGRNTLVCYVPSLGAGRNVLKSIAEKQGVDLNKYFYEENNNKIYDYENFYKELLSTNILFDIEETDSEVLWKFKDKDIELMAEIMQAQTSGADISPFSTRNLPKVKYEINNDDLREYKEITNQISEGNFLIISQLTNRFMSEIMSKSKAYKGKNLKEIQKKKMIKSKKEFIHSEGFWDKYIQFLRENI